MRIATSDPTGLYYNSNDHLTSASVITNVSGGVVQKLDYLPFGSERVNVKTSGFDTRFTFTDQEKDDESGLMYYGARYYNPVIGRFTSVDPAFDNFMEPQSFNKYAYTQNNPLKYIDPTGLSNLPAYDSAGHPMAIEMEKMRNSTGYQQLESFATSLTPYVETMQDVTEFASGRAWFTGEQLQSWQRALSGGLILIPFVGGAAARNIVKEIDDEITKRLLNLTKSFTQRLEVAQNSLNAAGINITEYALKRLVGRESRGVTTEIVIDTYQTGDLYYDTLNKNYNIIKNNVRLPLLDDQKTIGNVIPEKKINWSRFEKVTSNTNE